MDAHVATNALLSVRKSQWPANTDCCQYSFDILIEFTCHVTHSLLHHYILLFIHAIIAMIGCSVYYCLHLTLYPRQICSNVCDLCHNMAITISFCSSNSSTPTSYYHLTTISYDPTTHPSPIRFIFSALFFGGAFLFVVIALTHLRIRSLTTITHSTPSHAHPPEHSDRNARKPNPLIPHESNPIYQYHFSARSSLLA